MARHAQPGSEESAVFIPVEERTGTFRARA